MIHLVISEQLWLIGYCPNLDIENKDGIIKFQECFRSDCFGDQDSTQAYQLRYIYFKMRIKLPLSPFAG